MIQPLKVGTSSSGNLTIEWRWSLMCRAETAVDEHFFIFEDVELVGGKQSQPYCSENTPGDCKNAAFVKGRILAEHIIGRRCASQTLPRVRPPDVGIYLFSGV
jgi:hypothetical protein